ncbi:MAG: ATP-binding cassette domain-containing protein, partial [Pseudomonadota bacterium]
DGAATDQWRIDDLGQHVGYLPQEVGLLAGSVAENISRMSEERDDNAIIEAARRAGAHELLLGLPQGYDTQIGANGQRLSGGQRQRVALARALYSDPPILILDEPNANLDAQGEQALVDSIRDARSRGRTVVIMAHRPSAIAACDLLLMIDKGHQVDFGPRDEVLKRRTKNFQQLSDPAAGGDGGASPAQKIAGAAAQRLAPPAGGAGAAAPGTPSAPAAGGGGGAAAKPQSAPTAGAGAADGVLKLAEGDATTSTKPQPQVSSHQKAAATPTGRAKRTRIAQPAARPSVTIVPTGTPKPSDQGSGGTAERKTTEPSTPKDDTKG